MKPQISICIASYNNGLYISKCIESAINQTYENIELIIVDDNSNDNTKKILNKFNLINLKKVYLKKNNGLAYIRRFSYTISSGEYICFIDGDDYIEKHYVTTLYNTISKYDSDIAVGGFRNFNDMTNNSYYPKSINNEIISDIYKIDKNVYKFTKNFFPSDSWNKLYKRDFLKDKINFFSMRKGLIGSDKLFNHLVIFSRNGIKISYTDNIIYNHRIHNKSISTLKSYTRHNSEMLISYKLLDYLRKNNLKNLNITKIMILDALYNYALDNNFRKFNEFKKLYGLKIIEIHKKLHKYNINKLRFKKNNNLIKLKIYMRIQHSHILVFLLTKIESKYKSLNFLKYYKSK